MWVEEYSGRMVWRDIKGFILDIYISTEAKTDISIFNFETDKNWNKNNTDVLSTPRYSFFKSSVT